MSTAMAISAALVRRLPRVVYSHLLLCLFSSFCRVAVEAADPRDRGFGPQAGDEFDFTLEFEHSMFTALPAAMVIAASPIYLKVFSDEPLFVELSSLLYIKMMVSGLLFGVDCASLALWISMPAHRTVLSIAASVLACLAALCVLFIVYTKHRKALQSSSLISIYLTIGVLFDAAKTRSYYSRPGIESLGHLSIASAAFKGMLTILEEVPKRKHIKDEGLKKTVGSESLGGFWNRSLFLWVNRTLFLGFREVLTVDDLDNLAPEFSSETLAAKTSAAFSKGKNGSRYWLIWVCIIVLVVPLISVVIPRLCYSAFIFSQPLFIQRVVSFIGEQDPKHSKEIKAGLVGACALLFFGIAVSRALYNHANARLAILLRGALIAQIFKKLLLLTFAEAKRSAAVTLMSTDVEGIAGSLSELHDIWVSPIEIGVGIYLLARLVGRAAFPIAFPMILSAVVTFIIGKLSAPAQVMWNEKIEHRVLKTSEALSQITSIKLAGLELPVSKYIQSLRRAEIAAYKIVRLLWSVVTITAVLSNAMTPVIILAGGLYWNSESDIPTPGRVFTVLTVVKLIVKPLQRILGAAPRLAATKACFSRLRAFFDLPEIESQTSQTGQTSQPGTESSSNSANTDQEKVHMASRAHASAQSGPAVRFSNACVAPMPGRAAILQEVTLAIQQCTLAMLLGATGSGKTTLLRSIVGEASITAGSITKSHSNVAFCGQTPWIENVSIRQNIIGEMEFDPVAYDAVVNMCGLQEDFLRLPEGDRTIAGTDGSRLSGGQKHRVAMARAFYSRARIVVLDDVFSAIDGPTATSIFDGLFGEKGTVKKSGRTVILATNWIEHIDTADQVLLIDAAGHVSSQLRADGVVIPQQYYDQRQPSTSTSTSATTPSQSLSLSPSPSPLASTSATQPHEVINSEAARRRLEMPDLNARQHGDISLYFYYFKSIRKWLLILWIVSLFTVAATERMPQIFLRIWLETDPENDDYFRIYAALGGSSFIICTIMFGIYYLKLVPESAAYVHQILWDSVVKATLPFLTSIEMGVILNRFSQDMTLLSKDLPNAFLMFVYFMSFMILDIGVIAAGSKYTAIVIPPLLLCTYIVQFYYLRTSRQMRHLDLEAKTPLFTRLTEMAKGLEHIRGFGWEARKLAQCFKELDFSQKPYYHMAAIQRWLELVLDLLCAGVAVTLVMISLYWEESTSEAGLGLSLLTLISLSTLINSTIEKWAVLETAIGAIARLKNFITFTPQERDGDTTGQSLPEDWPEEGRIVFRNVTARYHPSDVHPVLNDVSVQIPGGLKFGITGRTGSGKSSLLRVLLNSLEYSGTITIDGVDISTIPRRVLRSRIITTITQDAVEVLGSVRDNLLPYEGQKEDETLNEHLLYEALDQLGLWGHIERHGGLDKTIDEVGLSEGQMQLLCVARAMLHHTHTNSRIIIMDEATSNMDVDLDRNVQEILTDFFVDCTMLVVAHRTETLQDCNRYIDMANGFVVGTR